jgi:hypothetical protein
VQLNWYQFLLPLRSKLVRFFYIVISSVGAPTLQYTNFDEDSYHSKFGHPLPKFIDVKWVEDVCTYLYKVNTDGSFEQ